MNYTLIFPIRLLKRGLFGLAAILPGATAQGQDDYELSWSDPSTYTVDCGTVVPAQWTVKNDSCNYASSDIYSGADDEVIEFSIRINQSGNLTTSDRLWIIIRENGVEQFRIEARGDTLAAVFSIDSNLLVEAGNFMTIEIALKTTDNTRFLQIKDGDITAGIFTPLPVSIASYSAHAEGQVAVLNWATASEKNNDYFTIQRSLDGQTYVDAGRVAGNGNTTVIHHYAFSDRSGNVKQAYYRLLQTDFDGKTSLAGRPVRLQFHGGPGIIKIFPNPVVAAVDLSLFLEDAQSIDRIRIFNRSGKSIYDITPESGVTSLVLKNTSRLDPGLYTVLVSADGDCVSKRVLVF